MQHKPRLQLKLFHFKKGDSSKSRNAAFIFIFFKLGSKTGCVCFDGKL